MPTRVLPRARRLALFLLASSSLLPGRTGAQSPPSAPPTVKLSGYLQARETWQEHVGLTASINRARLAAAGSVAPSVSYRVQGEFRTGAVGTGRASVSLQDAYIRFSRERWALQAGQFKTPFTREFMASLADLETADRATVVDSLAPKRDIGLQGEVSVLPALTLIAGIFNGEGQNVTANRDSTALGIVRAVVRPVPHVSLGANAARYFGDSTRYGVDANYEGERLTLRGEYVAQARDALDADHDRGWLVVGGYAVVPEVQLVGKYEAFERPALSDQQKNRAWTAGANLFPLGRTTRFTLEYLSRRIGDPGVRKSLLLAQAQVKF
jgi:Phosphate-selective porin O and P